MGLLPAEGEEPSMLLPGEGKVGDRGQARHGQLRRGRDWLRLSSKSGGPWLRSENTNQGPRGMEAIFDQEPAAGCFEWRERLGFRFFQFFLNVPKLTPPTKSV